MIAQQIPTSTILQFFVANARRDWERWRDEDLVGLQRDIGKVFGVYIVDPSNREDERAAIRLYDRTCRERRRPLIVLRMHERTCSIVLDLNPMGRDRKVNNGGLSDTELAAVDELMDTAPGRTSPYGRQLPASRIIRR
jgi:hypothetical protein